MYSQLLSWCYHCRTSRCGGVCCRNLQRCQWYPHMNPCLALSRLWRPSLWILSCPVTAMEAVCESLSCPVTAMEAICESSSCPVTAMEAVYESLSCPVAAIEAICELLPCFELTTEAINEPSFAHVTAYEPLSCPDPAKEADFELPVPSVTTEFLAMSGILSMHFRSLSTRGHLLTTLTLALGSLLCLARAISVCCLTLPVYWLFINKNLHMIRTPHFSLAPLQFDCNRCFTRKYHFSFSTSTFHV